MRRPFAPKLLTVGLIIIFGLIFIPSFQLPKAHAASFVFSSDTTLTTDQNILPGETWTIEAGVTLTVAAGVTVTNNGIIENRAIIVNAGTIDNGGAIFNHIGSTFNNTGTLNDFSFIGNDGTLNNNLDGIINFEDGFLNNIGTVNNGATINFEEGEITNHGTINNACGAIFTNSGGVLGNPVILKQCDFLNIEWTKTQVWNNNVVEVRANMKGVIPEDGKHGAFGYAWMTDSLNNVLVVVTHLGLDDSSHEDPFSGFHTHVIDLMAASASCDGFDAEVDLVGSAANAAFDSDYPFFVKNKRVEVLDVPASDLGDAGVESFATFTVTPVSDPDLHLCVAIVDTV